MLPETLKWLLKRLFARMGIQVSRTSGTVSHELHLLRIFSSLLINCVIDVGAHEGSFGRELRDMGYAGYIVSFEPVAENYAVLERASSGDPRWRVFPYALGDSTGQAEINVFSGSTFHSLLAPSAYGQEAFKDKMHLVRTERIEIKRLDEVLESCLDGIPSPRLFLKTDTQGHCLAVLEGAGRALDRVLALQIEAALQPIYLGTSATLANVLPVLQQRAFAVTGLFPVSLDKRDGLRIIEVDCVAIRSVEGISSHTRT